MFFNITSAQNPKSKYLTTKEFNNLHKNDPYKIIDYKDSLDIGSSNRAFIVIDTSKVHNIQNVKVVHNKIELERKQNKFKLVQFTYMPGQIEYTITITYPSKTGIETLQFKHSYFVRKTKTITKIDYVGLAEDRMPVFHSKYYLTFDDYLKKSILQKHIKVDELTIEYIAMSDGSTKLEQIKKNSLENWEDEDKIKAIVESYKGWIPGINYGKKVNVWISTTLKF